jgi:hypothetical protein
VDSGWAVDHSSAVRGSAFADTVSAKLLLLSAQQPNVGLW